MHHSVLRSTTDWDCTHSDHKAGWSRGLAEHELGFIVADLYGGQFTKIEPLRKSQVQLIDSKSILASSQPVPFCSHLRHHYALASFKRLNLLIWSQIWVQQLQYFADGREAAACKNVECVGVAHHGYLFTLLVFKPRKPITAKGKVEFVI